MHLGFQLNLGRGFEMPMRSLKHKKVAYIDNEMMRQFAVIRRLKLQLCPEFVFDSTGFENCVILYSHHTEKWIYAPSYALLDAEIPGVPYFDSKSAVKAVEMLNSGEVKI